MYVTAIHIPAFGNDSSKTIIGGLSGIYDDLKQTYKPGFIQSLLLREAKQGALLLTLWRSRSDLQRFLESSVGKETAKRIKHLLDGDDVRLSEYYPAWQVPSNDLIATTILGK